MYVPPILREIGEGEKDYNPLMETFTPELCNYHNVVRGVLPRE